MSDKTKKTMTLAERDLLGGAAILVESAGNFQSTLEEAERSAARRDKPFKCTLCGAGYATKRGLRRHNNSHDDTFVCDICGKRLGQKQYWIDHRASHLGLKKYRCDFPGCGKEYFWKGDLKAHQKKHQGAA